MEALLVAAILSLPTLSQISVIRCAVKDSKIRLEVASTSEKTLLRYWDSKGDFLLKNATTSESYRTENGSVHSLNSWNMTIQLADSEGSKTFLGLLTFEESGGQIYNYDLVCTRR